MRILIAFAVVIGLGFVGCKPADNELKTHESIKTSPNSTEVKKTTEKGADVTPTPEEKKGSETKTEEKKTEEKKDGGTKVEEKKTEEKK